MPLSARRSCRTPCLHPLLWSCPPAQITQARLSTGRPAPHAPLAPHAAAAPHATPAPSASQAARSLLPPSGVLLLSLASSLLAACPSSHSRPLPSLLHTCRSHPSAAQTAQAPPGASIHTRRWSCSAASAASARPALAMHPCHQQPCTQRQHIRHFSTLDPSPPASTIDSSAADANARLDRLATCDAAWRSFLALMIQPPLATKQESPELSSADLRAHDIHDPQPAVDRAALMDRLRAILDDLTPGINAHRVNADRFWIVKQELEMLGASLSPQHLLLSEEARAILLRQHTEPPSASSHDYTTSLSQADAIAAAVNSLILETGASAAQHLSPLIRQHLASDRWQTAAIILRAMHTHSITPDAPAIAVASAAMRLVQQARNQSDLGTQMDTPTASFSQDLASLIQDFADRHPVEASNPEVINAKLAYLCSSPARFPEAKQFFQSLDLAGMANPNLSARLYRRMLVAAARHDHDALLVQELIDALVNRLGIPLDRDTYIALMRSYLLLEDRESVVGIYESMCNDGHVPNLDVYAILIHAHAMHADTNNAFAVFRELLGRGLQPSLPMLVALLAAFTKSRDVLAMEAAESFFTKWIHGQAGLSVQVFNVMIHGYARRGQLADMLRWFDYMISNGYHPDAFTYSILRQGLLEFRGDRPAMGDSDPQQQADLDGRSSQGSSMDVIGSSAYVDALAMLSKSGRSMLPIDSYDGILTAFDSDFERLSGVSPSAVRTLVSDTIPMQHTFRTFGLRAGRAWFESYFGSADAKSPPDVATYSTVMASYMRKRQHRAAFQLFGNLGSQDLRPDRRAYQQLIRVCKGLRGRESQGLQLYDSMMASRMVPEDRTVVSVLQMCIRLGDGDALMRVVGDITSGRVMQLKRSMYARLVRLFVHAAAGGWEPAAAACTVLLADLVNKRADTMHAVRHVAATGADPAAPIDPAHLINAEESLSWVLASASHVALRAAGFAPSPPGVAIAPPPVAPQIPAPLLGIIHTITATILQHGPHVIMPRLPTAPLLFTCLFQSVSDTDTPSSPSAAAPSPHPVPALLNHALQAGTWTDWPLVDAAVRHIADKRRGDLLFDIWTMLRTASAGSVPPSTVALLLEQMGIYARDETHTRRLWAEWTDGETDCSGIGGVPSERDVWTFVRVLVWWGRVDEAMEVATAGVVRLGIPVEGLLVRQVLQWLKWKEMHQVEASVAAFWKEQRPDLFADDADQPQSV
ncbi:hypothetical protein BC831DRAFT_506259 [Entophlyctis helioformis]|nr:hypothetical protein BC831DRAFT_506259 [Entophlyctis helioformis]